jgi:hypothetical protein
MKQFYLLVVTIFINVCTVFQSNAQCPYPAPVVNVVNGVICNGSPAILSVPDIYDSYQWYWGGVPVPVAATDYGYWAVVQGDYFLEVVLNGCTTLTAPVFVSAPLVQPLNFPDTIYSCTNSLTIQLDTALYDMFQWSNGQTSSSFTFTQSGSVGVGVGINALSCGVADTFWVELNKPSPTVSITTIGSNPFCQDSSIVLESDNPNGNLWSTGETSQSIIVSTAGLYTVTVQNYFGCTATASVQANQIFCIPTTTLLPSFCPNYNLTQTSAIFCISVPGATQYEWQFLQNGNVYATKFTSVNATVLHGVSPQITWGNIYQVKVKPFVGGQWGAFGNICEIGVVPQPTPSTVPLTQLRPQSCGKLNYRINNSNVIIANSIYQAAAYEFEFSNPISGIVVATKIVPNHPVLFLNTVSPALSFPAQYNVRVRVFYGGVWGFYGNTCLIGIIGLNKDENVEDISVESDVDDSYFFDAGAYPNPFNGNAVLFSVSTRSENLKITIMDITGKTVDEFSSISNENISFGESFNNGLYFVRIVTENGYTKNIKIIKN